MSETRKITLQFPSLRAFLAEYGERLSTEGMLLRRESPPADGSRVDLEVVVAEGMRLVRARGEVLWSEAAGAGDRLGSAAVRFDELDSASRRLISKIVDQRRRQGAEPFSLERVPGPREARLRDLTVPAVGTTTPSATPAGGFQDTVFELGAPPARAAADLFSPPGAEPTATPPRAAGDAVREPEPPPPVPLLADPEPTELSVEPFSLELDGEAESAEPPEAPGSAEPAADLGPPKASAADSEGGSPAAEPQEPSIEAVAPGGEDRPDVAAADDDRPPRAADYDLNDLFSGDEPKLPPARGRTPAFPPGFVDEVEAELQAADLPSGELSLGDEVELDLSPGATAIEPPPQRGTAGASPPVAAETPVEPPPPAAVSPAQPPGLSGSPKPSEATSAEGAGSPAEERPPEPLPKVVDEPTPAPPSPVEAGPVSAPPVEAARPTESPPAAEEAPWPGPADEPLPPPGLDSVPAAASPAEPEPAAAPEPAAETEPAAEPEPATPSDVALRAARAFNAAHGPETVEIPLVGRQLDQRPLSPPPPPQSPGEAAGAQPQEAPAAAPAPAAPPPAIDDNLLNIPEFGKGPDAAAIPDPEVPSDLPSSARSLRGAAGRSRHLGTWLLIGLLAAALAVAAYLLLGMLRSGSGSSAAEGTPGATAPKPGPAAPAAPVDRAGEGPAAETGAAAPAGEESTAAPPGEPAPGAAGEPAPSAPQPPVAAALGTPQPPAAAAPATPLTGLSRITWTEGGDETVLALVGDGEIASRQVETISIGGAEPRLVIKIAGVQRAFQPAVLEVGTAQVRRVRTGLHAGGELHVVVDLAATGVSLRELTPRGSRLEVRLGSD